MRRPFASILTALTLVVPPSASSAGVPLPVASDNVEFMLNVPDVAGIGARVVEQNGAAYLYATTPQGLRIYDVTLGPPIPIGFVAVPHFEGEDIDTNGEIAIIGSDLGGIWVIDVSIPSAAHVIGFVLLGPNGVSGDGVDVEGSHTVTCLQDCRYAWTNGIEVIDLADPTHPRVVGALESETTHDINVDAQGLAWSSITGDVFDVSSYGPGDLLAPPLVAKGTFGNHNSLRPDAERATPELLANAVIDPGELVLGTDEDFFADANGACAADGPLKTSWLRTVDGELLIEPLHSFRLGQRPPPSGAIAPKTCSSHWFDEHDGIVADAWYQQGVRFLDVSSYHDPSRADTITEIGYWVPPNGVTWSAEVQNVTRGPMPGLYVYTSDVGRGMDVLRFTGRPGDPPTSATASQPSGPSESGVPPAFTCRLR